MPVTKDKVIIAIFRSTDCSYSEILFHFGSDTYFQRGDCSKQTLVGSGVDLGTQMTAEIK